MTTLKRIIGPVVFEPEVTSTNDRVAARAALGAPEGLVLVAETQTAGRGRQGRSWHSPPGSGLYVSVLLRPPSDVVPLLTLAGGLAIAEALRESTGLPVQIKWPNDVLAPGGARKLAGILVEGSASAGRFEHAIFGYGINVRSTAYPLELRDRATSLEEELGRPVDAQIVLSSTLAALDARYGDLLEGRGADVLARWSALAPRARGARIEYTVGTERRTGVSAGIDSTGALLVDTARGLERLVSGDVTWL